MVGMVGVPVARRLPALVAEEEEAEVSMGEERGRTDERKSRAWGEVAARSRSREVEGGKDRENRI